MTIADICVEKPVPEGALKVGVHGLSNITYKGCLGLSSWLFRRGPQSGVPSHGPELVTFRRRLPSVPIT